MKSLPLCLVVVLSFILRASADEVPAKYADLVNVYMQLAPLNDQAKVSLPGPIQGVGTSHEGQGWMISLNRGGVSYREQDSSKPSNLDIITGLNMETLKREGDKYTFSLKVRSVYPSKGLLKSEYGQNEVVFSEGYIQGAVAPMGIFQKELVLANGEKYAVSISMSPFSMPPDWKAPPSAK